MVAADGPDVVDLSEELVEVDLSSGGRPGGGEHGDQGEVGPDAV